MQAHQNPHPTWTRRQGLNNTLARHKYGFTLGLILLVHVCLAAVEDRHSALFSPLFILLLDFCVFIYLLLRERTRMARIVLATGATAMLLSGFSLFVGGLTTVIGGLALHGVFLLLLIVLMLGHLVRERTVTLDTVLAGVIVYLVMAAFWTQLYSILILITPGAIQASGGLGLHPYTTLYYFSIITITTAGFGDIVPTGDLARMLTAYEALVGQVYLVVFIALLMGRHFANR